MTFTAVAWRILNAQDGNLTLRATDASHRGGDSDEEHLVHREVRELVNASTLKITRLRIAAELHQRTEVGQALPPSLRTKIKDMAPS